MKKVAHFYAPKFVANDPPEKRLGRVIVLVYLMADPHANIPIVNELVQREDDDPDATDHEQSQFLDLEATVSRKKSRKRKSPEAKVAEAEQKKKRKEEKQREQQEKRELKQKEKEEKARLREEKAAAKRKLQDEKRAAKEQKARDKTKTKPRERKLMEAAQEEFPRLLNTLQDPDGMNVTHFDFPDAKIFAWLARGLKWAFLPLAEDSPTPAEHICPGRELFWEWWSAPMLPGISNKIWQKKIDENLLDKKEQIKREVDEEHGLWNMRYEECRPSSIGFHSFRDWVRYELRKRQITLNPGPTDKEMSDIALQYISDKFIVIDADGSSIVWEEEHKLWILRKKERSGVALGQALWKLIDRKIQFTDEDLKKKFTKKLEMSTSVSNVLKWLQGSIAKFPNPIKDKLDREMWCIALQDGKLADLRTLEIRDRTSADLFTIETKFKWFTDGPSLNSYIMDAKLIPEFKKVVKEGTDKEILAVLVKLCPNATAFTNGPFSIENRHIFALKNMGLFLTTHSIRKAVWIFGDGKGMKSTVFSAVVNCLGDFGIILNKKVFFNSYSSSESGHNTDLMRAEGKRLVYVDELEKETY